MAIFGIDLEALAGSAAHVAGQGDDLASAHLASDNRIAGAESGWVGASAVALGTTAATWLQTSRRLLTRVGDHALELAGDGIVFAAMETENAATLGPV
ncbi:hypothetical protein A5658_16665 [Mycobacterium sp. 1245111.1]|uniref:hypothetical protein n=1 Tax=Mycobacterium sp. 1245111.1 TaxID=1834073 RepID=UPI0007FCB3B7|nr:hypothetical protein [Mycobacterium sp. 1245111.1]OBK32337.1 hypothetical protein A5658_16665 [Mycobacterium sp. 1245111.1]